MRYLLGTSGPTGPLLPFDEAAFQDCIKLLHIQMHRHNEEYKLEHPPETKPLVYFYR